ncbi:MAG: hypothetical protein ABI588_06845 [Arenimonas sp.]
MSDLRFRLAGTDDAEALAAFMTRNFLATYGDCSTAHNVAAALAMHYGVDAQRRLLTDQARINLMAERSSVLVGHAQLHLGGQVPDAVAPLPQHSGPLEFSPPGSLK